MSSAAVQIASGPQGFMQNGQVDWVAFANSLWSTSSVVLQRFSSAGVQPITFGAGLALASQIRLGRLGNRRMHSAIEDIQGFWSMEKLLYFGFGARSFLRVMADTQLGVDCIALCASLAELHSEHASAWILEELWKLHGYPREYLPSHSQLTALVKACSGILIRTEFSAIPDRMLGYNISTSRLEPDISNPEDIARAIYGLGEISNGKVSTITITGGFECAYVAAFAHWLLNLSISVEDEGGRMIYQDLPPEQAQVVIAYRRQADLSLVQVSSNSYILRTLDDIFIHSPDLSDTFLYLRTPWDGCLARLFGTAFSNLTRAPNILGDFMGSVARIYRGLATGESDVGNFSRKSYINFIDSSHGEGFIDSVVSIFPELKRLGRLFDKMHSALNVPLKEALRTVERTTLDLAQLCNCSCCTVSGADSETHCLLAIIFAIRELVSTISCTVMDDKILPNISGIRGFYVRAYNHLMACKVNDNDEISLLSVAVGLPMEGMVGAFVKEHTKFDLLSHPMELFSGYCKHDRYYPENNPGGREFCSATVRQGLCYYLDCLRSLSSIDEHARIVHVVPGHIQMGDRQYDSAYDPGQVDRGRSSPIKFDIIEKFDSGDTLQQPRWGCLKAEPHGLEKMAEHQLVVFYKALIPNEPPVNLPLCSISRHMLINRGVLTSDGRQCVSRLNLPCVLVRQGWRAPDENLEALIGYKAEKLCFIWPQLDDLGRCIVTQMYDSSVFFRRTECISCCTTSLLRESVLTPKGHYHIV